VQLGRPAVVALACGREAVHGVGDPVDRVGHTGGVERLLHDWDGVERRRRVVLHPGEVQLGLDRIEPHVG
jgi:hypothetical protein